MFTVKWIQHAVGHGGFHTAHASVNIRLNLNWVFDCGATRSAVLRQYVEDWTAHDYCGIDWLFISHFDNDHVSGLETLMSRVHIRDVVVPYVNDEELASQLLLEVGRDNLERSIYELIADPADFFLSRGAERVTFVTGRAPGSEPAAPGFTPDGPKGEDGWTTKILPPPVSCSVPAKRRRGKTQIRVQKVESGSRIYVMNGTVGMRLLPHRAPASEQTRSKLLIDLKTLVGMRSGIRGRPGLGELAFAIGRFARTASGRSSLRNLFAHHVNSSNRSSLSLLSTPIIEDPADGRWWLNGGNNLYNHEAGIAAWVNTGDAELLDPDVYQDWLQTFGSDLPITRVLALPHHGSDKNSGAEFQQSSPHSLLVAHAKEYSAKHPGPDVRRLARHRLHCVTNDKDSRVQMSFSARVS